jgi:NAD-dependent SIR2 family protein deacetylase
VQRTQPEIIEALRKLSNPQDCILVPFIGAGASVALGLPDWKDLVKDYHTGVSCKLDFEQLCYEWSDRLPQIAFEIFKDTGSNISKYYSFMAAIKPKEQEYQPLHAALLKFYKKLITTNYDTAFEEANKDNSHWQSLNLMSFPGNLNPLDFQNNTIAHIHGHVKKNAFIFRSDEYEAGYNKTNEITDFIRSIIKKYSLLFIGFSFEDLIFKEKLAQVVKEEKERANIIFQVFEKDYRMNSIKDFFVIIPKKYKETDLLKTVALQTGVDPTFLDNYFDLSPDDKLILKAGKTFDEQFRKQEIKFIKEFKRINTNKERLAYFADLNIEPLEYNGDDRTEIRKLIWQIGQNETGFTDDTSTFPSTTT